MFGEAPTPRDFRLVLCVDVVQTESREGHESAGGPSGGAPVWGIAFASV